MSLRFRRRIRVIPGVYINVGKTGISTSIGPRGANINVSKRGVYMNTGIPGTGLSYRSKLSGKSNTQKTNEQNYPDPVQDEPIEKPEVTTSAGLIGLNEIIEEARATRNKLASDISETIQRLNQVRKKLDRKKNGFIIQYFTRQSTLDRLENEITELQTYLEEINQIYETSRADITLNFDDSLTEQYKIVKQAFIQLCTSEKIWDITSISLNNSSKSWAKHTVKRQEVKFNLENIDFIQCDFPAFHFQNADGGQLYLYPAFILTTNKTNKLTLIDIKDFNFKFIKQNCQERKESIPTDAKIIEYTWWKVNKNGSPDLRFKNNYQIPVALYGGFDLTSSNGLNESYSISNVELAELFATELQKYMAMLADSTTPPLSNTFT